MPNSGLRQRYWGQSGKVLYYYWRRL